MSVIDAVWIFPPLAGVALGLVLRSSWLALLLGFTLVVTSFILFGYSVDHYSNNDCQPGEPCPPGEQIIEVLTPVLFLAGSALVIVSSVRTMWNIPSWGAWRRRRA